MSNDTKSISKEEVALYDRQIRLWGMEAQTRLRNASILIIGVKSLTLEASKNLVLAGIGHLTLSDSSPVTETDLISAYYCYEADVGKRKDEQLSERLKILNPLVDIEARTVGDDELQLFDMVVVVGQSFEVAKRINSVCRRNGVKMVVADAFGLFGFAFADCLEQHEFVVETKKVEGKTGEPETKREKKAIPYVTLEASLGKSFGMPVRRMRRVMSPLIIIYQAIYESLAGAPALSEQELLDAAHMVCDGKGIPRDYIQPDLISRVVRSWNTELVPCAAMVGGTLTQEILKIITKKERPIHNWFVYDARMAEGVTFTV